MVDDFLIIRIFLDPLKVRTYSEAGRPQCVWDQKEALKIGCPFSNLFAPFNFFEVGELIELWFLKSSPRWLMFLASRQYLQRKTSSHHFSRKKIIKTISYIANWLHYLWLWWRCFHWVFRPIVQHIYSELPSAKLLFVPLCKGPWHRVVQALQLSQRQSLNLHQLLWQLRHSQNKVPFFA